ncbi:ATP synthase delta chain chloroplastic [Bienertia sinuspersici]
MKLASQHLQFILYKLFSIDYFLILFFSSKTFLPYGKNKRSPLVENHQNLHLFSASPTFYLSTFESSLLLQPSTMATLQNPVALQSRTTTSAALSTSSAIKAPKPFSLSFSSSTATFNPLRLPTLSSSRFTTAKPRGGGALGARMSDTAAARYASALADVANSNDTLEATNSDVEKIGRIFSEEQVYDFFANPVISIENKRSVLDEIVSSAGLQPHTANFLNILIDSERIALVKDIAKAFEDAYNRITNTEVAVVSSVVKLENEHLAQIAKGVQRLTGAKNVRIKTEIDPSLVAGFTIRYGNGGSKMVDMSVKKQLEEIAAQLEMDDVNLPV